MHATHVEHFQKPAICSEGVQRSSQLWHLQNILSLFLTKFCTDWDETERTGTCISTMIYLYTSDYVIYLQALYTNT